MMRRVGLLVLILLLVVPQRAGAGPVGLPEIIGVRVGFSGHYKVGVWTPVEVRFDRDAIGAPDTLHVTVPDGDGVPSRVSAEFTGDENSALLYVRFGRVQSELAVELRSDDQVLASKRFTSGEHPEFPPAVAATGKIILGVGVDPLGLKDAVARLHEKEDARTVAVRLENGRQLPDRWYGYEGIEALVISTSQPEIFADWTPSSPQVIALERWIRMGGRLVLCVGSRAEEVLGEDSPWAAFAPGKLSRMVDLRQTRALESYAAGEMAIETEDEDGLRIPRLLQVQGTIEAREADLPLVVRTARGLGQIVFLAADLDRGPLAKWKDRPLLTARLLDLPTEREEESKEGSAVMHYGFNDLTGQLRSALEQFNSVRLIPFWLIVVMIVVYILLIGPADYFLLRKVLRRMMLTWVTFSATVVVVAAAAYLLAYDTKGTQLRLNQVDLLDIDATSGNIRGTTWCNLFSPRTDFYDLTLQPKLPSGKLAQDADLQLSWLGLPGGALGGMNPRTISPDLWAKPYDFSPQLDALHDVPISIWSTKSFTARWMAKTDICPQADLRLERQQLLGNITNTLPFALSECLLAHGRHVYPLGTLEPGQSIRIDTRLRRSELKTLLTRRQIVADKPGGDFYQKSTPYDLASVQLPYILQAMMFYEAAGGRQYTHLENGYQRFVDSTELLKTDRALLVGQAPEDHPGATLSCNGKPLTDNEDQHLTVYRFVFTVDSSLSPNP